MGFLADTNVVSELARQRPDPGVVAWASSVEKISLSVITLDEVRYGLALRANPRVEAFFETLLRARIALLAVTREVADRAGTIRGQLAKRGDVRSSWDMIIGATAAVHDLTLVTRNIRHFGGCGASLLNPFAG